MALEDVVNVQVNINQATIAQQGFGVPLIYGHHLLSERVLSFRAGSWSSEMLSAGIDPDSAVYRAAERIMMQSPRPVEFRVGRASDETIQKVTVTVLAAVEGVNYRVTARASDGTETSVVYVGLVGDTLATVATGLAAALVLVPGITAVAGAATVTISVTEPDQVWSFTVTEGLALADATSITVSTVEDDLNAIRDVDNSWYALMLTSGAPSLIEKAAEWVEVNKKIMVASTSDASVYQATGGTPDVATKLKDLNYLRTHVVYHPRDGEFYGPSWVASVLIYEPGQVDWKFKELRGVQPTKLSATDANRLLGRNASYYETLIGEPSTGAAKGADGTFLDLVQLSDWLRARITEGIVRMLKSAPKVPFTDQGSGNSIWGVLRGVALVAIRNSAIEEDPDSWQVYVPLKKDLVAADVIARTWNGCILNVTPTGAVHSVGTITVNINVVS